MAKADLSKTKAQLAEELDDLRRRLRRLEDSPPPESGPADPSSPSPGARPAEAAPSGNEIKYRALLENSQDYIMRLDLQGRVIYASPNVSEAGRVKAEDFIGRTHRELGLPAELVDDWASKFRDTVDSGKPVEGEFEFDGGRGPREYQFRLIPEFDSAGAFFLGGEVRIENLPEDVSRQGRRFPGVPAGGKREGIAPRFRRASRGHRVADDGPGRTRRARFYSGADEKYRAEPGQRGGRIQGIEKERRPETW